MYLGEPAVCEAMILKTSKIVSIMARPRNRQRCFLDAANFLNLQVVRHYGLVSNKIDDRVVMNSIVIVGHPHVQTSKV